MPSNYHQKYYDSKGLLIYTQSKNQKENGKRIIKLINQKWNPTPYYYYHLKDGGHVSAIQAHLHNIYFAKIDIKKFFNSVTRRKIIRALVSTGISYKNAYEIAGNSIVKNNNAQHLPFGFVQSPMLATLALHKSALGKFLKTTSANTDAAISVYMDDILLSSNNQSLLQKIVSELINASKLANFTINNEKLVMPCRELCAFNIELSHNNMLLSSSRFKDFESNIANELIKEEPNQNVIHGIISYVHTVNIEQRDHLISLITPQKLC